MHAPLSPSAPDHSPRKPGWFSRTLAPVFRRQLDRIDAGIAKGSLSLGMPDGTARLLGGRADGPAAVVDLRSWRALLRLAIGGSIGWYQAWALGEWASPDPVQLFALFGLNRAELARQARATGFSKAIKRLLHWRNRNHRGGSRRNIHFHYDLGNDFYRLWLDPGMTYSSALFATPGQSLEAAQHEKLAATLARTNTKAGDEILEIGCGWGSFAELAVAEGRKVHGITLSTEQKAWAEARVPQNARFTLTDYRDVTGSYDAVASIEMAEAVGQAYWPAYLDAIAGALKPGGRAALQVITFDDAFFEDYASNVDFIQAYVFPGGLLLSEERFGALAAARGLKAQGRTGFGLDYAETLRLWREHFDAAVAAGALPEQFDRKFIDLWRYYLMYCEGGFRGGGIDVIQLTLVKEEG
ncbi:cyclopropane-fatty-acyl-phospholipid synthase [Sphingomonas kyeonggiensis]|uniref:SAM-dependent methyltransferase n=1 Tax=Sphingomonas kyeonggiensis TaxID=1268553 RepID=UPI00277EC790|nr:cyclopropane-fatty-acyl-phospholipid synthase family protein [Sphingomonas kyeonggiensis]MDQ0251106.1 cyclopropane-fatty-acyl-phospholipid synthase [Sphingomonas kyeonggiensis]